MSEQLLAWAQVVALVVSVSLNVWIYGRSRNDRRWEVMHERLDGFGNRHAELDKRLAVIETEVDSMPTQRDLVQIRDRLAHIDKNVAGLDERTGSTLASVRRIEQYLLENRR